jgi:hypothetical protein
MALPRHVQSQPIMFGEVSSTNTTVIQASSFDHWDRRQEFKLSEFLALGFYFVGSGIRCSSCGRIQTEWNPTKNLLVQHGAFNTQCPMVQEFYHNPLINYYYCNDQILQDLHAIIVEDNIRNVTSINFN